MIPRQYALVKVTSETKLWLQNNNITDSPLLLNSSFIYLGEIPNMPGHCVVAEQTSGKVHSGFHIENFVEMEEDEI